MKIQPLKILAAVAASLACGFVLAAAGDADPSFGGAGYVRYAGPRALAGYLADAIGFDDGSVLVAGARENTLYLRRYRADGTLDTGHGDLGTEIVPGFEPPYSYADGYLRDTEWPRVRMVRDPSGRIWLWSMLNGGVTRLTSDASYDSAYGKVLLQLDVTNPVTRTWTVLPQADGRFVVVNTPQISTNPNNDTLRITFLRADGKRDVARGDLNGERSYFPPGGIGNYIPTSAATDTSGRVVVVARWNNGVDGTGIVIIRLRSDGTYDPEFGQGGIVVVANSVGSVGDPQVKIGADQRIAVVFGVPQVVPATPYFVVSLFTSTGQPDASAPNGGRISITPPAAERLDTNSLRWINGTPDLLVTGTTIPDGLPVNNHPPYSLMFWRGNLTSGTIGAAEYTRAGMGNDFRVAASVSAGSRVWTLGTEDYFTVRIGGTRYVEANGRSVILQRPIDALSTTTLRSEVVFTAHLSESISNGKLLSDGKILTLGTYSSRGVTNEALTRYNADGTLDPTYAGGTGRRNINLAYGQSGKSVIVPSSGDTVTLLTTRVGNCISSSSYAALQRFTPAGDPDTTFNGGVPVPLIATPCDPNPNTGTYVRGFVDGQGRTLIGHLSGSQPYTIEALRYTIDGKVDSTFRGVPLSLVGTGPAILQTLPTGELQAIVVSSGGTQQMVVNVKRWTREGMDDFTSRYFPISAVDATSTPRAIDALVLPDSSTLVAIDQASQRIVVKLNESGLLDPAFGSGGIVRLDGASAAGVKLAVAFDGKVLLAHNAPLGNGNAIAVARFNANGQPDNTFTSDGKFDSLFSLSGAEGATDLIAHPDGHVLVFGRSAEYGLMLGLRGLSTTPPGASAPVVEFYNTYLDHYFVSAGPGEIIAVDTGAAGSGWQRTGFGFRAYIPEYGVPANAIPVCRFYGTPGHGPNSHFYTASAAECEAVKRDPGWTYEGVAFYVNAQINDRCPGSAAVYRAYNNGFVSNNSNHRYSTQRDVLQAMTSQGWSVEGVAFCGSIN